MIVNLSIDKVSYEIFRIKHKLGPILVTQVTFPKVKFRRKKPHVEPRTMQF